MAWMMPVRARSGKVWGFVVFIFAILALNAERANSIMGFVDRFRPDRTQEVVQEKSEKKVEEVLANGFGTIDDKLGKILQELKSSFRSTESEVLRPSIAERASKTTAERAARSPDRPSFKTESTDLAVATPAQSGAAENSSTLVTQQSLYSALTSYFSARAKQRAGLLAKYPDLDILIHNVRANPYVGSEVAACEVEAEVINGGRKIVYRDIFRGDANFGRPPEIGDRACQAAIDSIFAKYGLSYL